MADGHGKQHHGGHILQLPNEILSDIFAYFRRDGEPADIMIDKTPRLYLFGEPLWRSDDDKASEEKLAVIQNARLVCRRFHDVASPLLIPVLRVYVDSPSLHRMDQITSNQDLAPGVQLIQLVVGYRPREIVLDPARFLALSTERMRTLLPYLRTYRMPYDEADPNLPFFLPVLEDFCNGGMDGCMFTHDAEFAKLLLGCFHEYCLKYQDQARLLADGLFAARLGAYAGRMAAGCEKRIGEQDCVIGKEPTAPEPAPVFSAANLVKHPPQPSIAWR